MLAILLSTIAALSMVLARVSVSNPLDNQYPLIARVDQNYSWTMTSKTFSTDLDSSLNYVASGLPAWLSFNESTLTFYGVPRTADQGRPSLTVTASDSESTASSSFALCVTPYPGPTVQTPISQQFYAGNQALSSVFFLSPGSALSADQPTLRVPSQWSFSIGLDGNTFVTENNLYYGALQSDLTPLPNWITFDPLELTFDGVASGNPTTPLTLKIIVFGADQEGYSAASVGFDLVVATHELSANSTLPTVNVTTGTPFNVTMSSPADFTGVLVDGQPLQPANASVLSIDVSAYKDWLEYDPQTKTLFGTPPDNYTAADGKPVLPVMLTSNFNQTLYTSVDLDIVPSFFSKSDLGTIQVDPGQTVQFDLVKFFANASSAQHHDATLSASYNPPNADAYLKFDPVAAQLTGQIPVDSNTPEICVMFVAYSYLTHSTSHSMLSVESPELEKVKGGGTGDVGTPSKSQVTLIVSLVFGIVGGVFFLGFALALFRRCARTKDTAIPDEEGAHAWTEEEKRWYGIGIEVRGQIYEHGYGWTNQADTSAVSEKGSLEMPTKEGSPEHVHHPPNRTYLGLGLRRVLPHAPTTPSTVQASCAEGVMKKAEFFGKIKNTARNVSNKYKRRSPPRPNISHPVALVRRDEMNGVPIQGQYVEIVRSPPRAGSTTSIHEDHLTEQRASTMTSFTTSPSNSTGDRSIPRRRADFAPPNSPRGPRAPAPAALREPARRSTIRESLQSTSGISAESHPESLRPGEERPRLKQFTHASRVPPPRSPSSNVTETEASAIARRIASQTAQIYKESREGRQMSIDELRIGMHYVRSLGEGSSNVRSASDKSFSSLESSQPGHGTSGKMTSARFLVRVGEKFKFRVPMQPSKGSYRKLEARLVSGRALPSFMQAELKSSGGKGDEKRAVEFYGVPTEGDMGELHVGVFSVEGGECLARVVVEVIARGKKTPPMTG